MVTGTHGTATTNSRIDFFVSYTGRDQEWAEWIAWQLEAAGYSVLIQVWDFGPGSHFVTEMHRAARDAARTVMVLSERYLASAFAEAEWQAAWRSDPSGQARRLLGFRIESCQRPGLLGQLVVVDLFDVDKAVARERILKAARQQRGKPEQEPSFPVSGAAHAEPVFPAGTVHVRDANPRRLGVHPAIAEPGEANAPLPVYVERDVDRAVGGLRDRLGAAVDHGGFILLVGGSSVGKTRTAFEALLAVVPDWSLIHPDGPGDIVALARRPPGRMVLWLDELQRFIDDDDRVTGGIIRGLLNAAEPVVIIATIWPENYDLYTRPPVGGSGDRHAREREVVNLAEVIRIGSAFTGGERARPPGGGW